MESAHLTKAHDHVRNAQTATLSSSIATAGDEHDHAAALFRQAAEDTHNDEALRILALLEDHHRKLAGLIKEAPRKPDKKSDSITSTSTSTTSTTAAAAKTTRTSSPSASTSSSAPRTHRRLPQSSIASNLAEKRGIPSARRTTSGTPLTVSGANAPRDAHATPVRDLLERHARNADQSRSKELPAPAEPASPPPEDNFRRFYSAFGGVISAISAPLAFTSLPLNPTPSTPTPEPRRTEKQHSRTSSPEASRTVKSSVPDLAALISKPALRALRSDAATPLNPNESFYLVPPSGGTVTYASMLQGAAAQPLDSIDEDPSLKGSHDEFVDAQETPGPPSPTRRRSSTTQPAPNQRITIPAGRGTGHKTHEELALENATLKSLVDKQAKRLQMWETNSQNQFNALAQSMRRPPPAALNTTTTTTTPTTPSLTPTPTTLSTPPDPDPRIATLESRIALLTSTNAHLAKQSDRDKLVIARYRDQWEKLKAGARRKELERRSKGTDDAVEGDGDAVS